MVNRTLARRYAVAIDALAREREIAPRIASDLTAMAQTIAGNKQVFELFASPVIPRPDKERVFADAFGDRVDPVALHAVLLLVRKRRETLLPAMVAEYLALRRAAAGAETLELTSARALDRDEYRELVEKLQTAYGKKFEVTEKVDPSLIGGLRLMIGDHRIDASIAGRLDNLARELTIAS